MKNKYVKEIQRLNQELKNVKAERDEYKAKYDIASQDVVSVEHPGRIVCCRNGAILVNTRLLLDFEERVHDLNVENSKLQTELNEYKQKYADEVQKRLDLISALQKE